MSRNLQFAFLGCHNSYLASATWVNQSGYPYEAPVIVHHGLFPTFVQNYCRFAENKYVYNIRGHDCFAFLGNWTRGAANNHTPASAQFINEVEGLRVLGDQNKAHKPPYKAEDLLLSLGPGPGAFFADAFRLKRYRWHNLPADLEGEIQTELGHKKYGSIYDVALNSIGGWVLQTKKGKKYNWGGILSTSLEQALTAGQARKAIIKHLYLNHQNAHDYVLVFTDGYTHISLHQGFEDELRRLILSTFPKPQNVRWNFIPSCYCDEHQQQQINAAYYNRRGHFHFQRHDLDAALTYMREAANCASKDSAYFDDYCMVLVAVRQKDATPEESYMSDFNPQNSLRNEYVFMRSRIVDVGPLEERIRELLRAGQMQQQRLRGGWAYSDVMPVVAELPTTGFDARPQGQIYELQGRDNGKHDDGKMLEAGFETGKQKNGRNWR
ncbi:hypothetical protein K491DRAFT_784188 [Lophiostoma macrostomum CBS 122681]|uniref:Uncharacterized protein n=1 Tax=Lophiostoma macrostomum CBS 122681 TaxID=1314788 RepID=A0A6A6SK75_9PLEO|nr:hypothetical protein K491DRAFT_784188 [Lophiostoma macrostomum CBS 122681]